MPIRISILVLALVVSAIAPATAAPPPRPIAPDERASGDVDLAALVLRPSDIDYQGAHFWYDWGYYGTIDDSAAAIAAGTRGDPGEARAALEDAGWAQSYVARMVTPSGDDPSRAGVTVYSGITRFDDERGAETGYDMLEGALADDGHVPARGADGLGDASSITRVRVREAGSPPGQMLSAVVLQGTFVVHVAVTDYADEPPPVGVATELGDLLLERIAGSEQAPGLSNLALMVSGNGVVTDYAAYRRYENEQIAFRFQAPGDVRADDELYSSVGAISYYQTRQWAPIPGDDDDFFDLKLSLLTFENDDAASTALRDWTEGHLESPAAGFVEVRRIRRAAELGDESVTIAYGFDRGATGTTYGYQFSIRAGDVLILIIGDALTGSDQSALEEIAAAALACVAESVGCAPMTLPDALVEGRDGAG